MKLVFAEVVLFICAASLHMWVCSWQLTLLLTFSVCAMSCSSLAVEDLGEIVSFAGNLQYNP